MKSDRAMKKPSVMLVTAITYGMRPRSRSQRRSMTLPVKVDISQPQKTMLPAPIIAIFMSLLIPIVFLLAISFRSLARKGFDPLPTGFVRAPYNDLAAVERLFAERGSKIAAVILEPVVGNMGVLVPRAGYLQGLLDTCRKHGALLIVDEVMTGFRVGFAGACGLYGLEPDLVTFGKVIGGGLPVGAFGGRADVMDRVAPAGPIYQSGTLSGNPMAMAAGTATLKQMTPDAYKLLELRAAALAEGLVADRDALRSVDTDRKRGLVYVETDESVCKAFRPKNAIRPPR